jgi:hypothetical protein
LELRKVNVSIRQTYHPCVDDSRDDPSMWTGWSVTTDNESKPFILLRGVRDFELGPVKTWFIGDVTVTPDVPLYLGPDWEIRFQASGTWGEDCRVIRDYPLSVRMGANRQSQVLVSNRIVYPQEGMSIVWVGDLDRDGKPDVLLDESSHYDIERWSLYLSTYAERDELVKYVARFQVGPC